MRLLLLLRTGSKIIDNFDNIRCIGIDFLGIENTEEGRKTGWFIKPCWEVTRISSLRDAQCPERYGNGVVSSIKENSLV